MQYNDKFANVDYEEYLNEKIPGYQGVLSDPKEQFNRREIVTFNSDKYEYRQNDQLTVRVANDSAFLDVDNSYLQCEIQLEEAKYGDNDANQRVPPVPNQLASSVIQRLQITAGGQNLMDTNFADIYLHIYHLANNEDDIPYMLWYNGEKIQENLADDFSGNDVTTLAEFNKQQSNTYNQQIKSRLNEDIKRARQFYKWGRDYDDAGTKTHVGIATYRNNDNINAKILFHLDQLPVFSKGHYFPLFALKGALQFQITLNQNSNVFHTVSNWGADDDKPIPNYIVKNPQMVCAMIYPTQQYITNYENEIIANGDAKYLGAYAEGNQHALNQGTGTIIHNISLSRLRQSTHIIREKGQQKASNERYSTNALIALVNSYRKRSSKWFSPLGQLNYVAVRVNGKYIPQSYGQTLASEAHVFEVAKQVLKGLKGLKDKERFYLDQAILAFNYKKDVSGALMDVSGISTAQSNQVQLEYSTDQWKANTELISHFCGEQVIQFLPSGQLIVFR